MLKVTGYKKKFIIFRNRKILVLSPIYKDMGPARAIYNSSRADVPILYATKVA
jgi:hypothetical protein